MQATSITLGDTLNYTTAVTDYPANAGWVLKTRLVPRSAGPTPVLLTSAADSTDLSLHRIQASAATTAGWTAGVYSWASYVEKAAESYLVDSGVVTLRANPRTATTLDTRSDAQLALDNVKAMLQNKATAATLRYRIGDRELQSYAMTELVTLQSQLVTAVKREERAAALAKGLGDPSKVYVRVQRG